MSCIPCSSDEVDLAFREAEPYIEEEIRDRSYALKRFWLDLFPVKLFPDGAGHELTKVRFFGDIGPQYDGFDGWREEAKTEPAGSDCDDGTSACGYKWCEVGHGFEEVTYRLMRKDIRTKEICVEDIRTTWQYAQYQDLLFNNLTEITSNIREQLNRNAAIALSVKHVPTAKGLQVNQSNPYELPNVTNVEVGRLNFRNVKRIYNALLREAGMYALDMMNGRPVFGLIASDDVLDDLFYEDPDIREDIRLGSPRDSSLISRYGFNDSIRGMFVAMPDMYAPRYNQDANGELVRVFPYVREVEIQSGTRPVSNPAYEVAEFELVQIMTRDLFSLRTRRAISSVGGGTSFDAESGMFDWKWFRDKCKEDPNGRVGFYHAHGRIGIEPGDFTDVPSLLVRRRPSNLDTTYWPQPECPVAPVPCDNELGPQGCPTPLVVNCCPTVVDNELLITFSRDISTDYPGGTAIQLETATGGLEDATIGVVGSDPSQATVVFANAEACCPGRYRAIAEAPSQSCSADVLSCGLCEAAAGVVSLQLCSSVKGLVGENLMLEYGNGAIAPAPITEIDGVTLTYKVTLTEQSFCENGGVRKVYSDSAVYAECAEPAEVACDPASNLPQSC